TPHDEKLIVRAVQRVEAVDTREEVVICQDEEPIAVRSVPAHHFVRCTVAVAVERVRVGVALVPVRAGRSRLPTAGPGHGSTPGEPYSNEEQEQSEPGRFDGTATSHACTG